MIILSHEQEMALEKAGFVASDTSVVYLGAVAVRGDMRSKTVKTSRGEQVQCSNDTDFVNTLLSKIQGN